MRNNYCIGIVGASGAVGQVLLNLIKEQYPQAKLRLFTSARSAGQRCPSTGLLFEETTIECFPKLDLIFLAVESELSLALAPILKGYGTWVVDKSSAFRLSPDVPLVVPEINGKEITINTRWVSSPNCSAIITCMALKPVQQLFGLKDVVISTYQAASGAGQSGVNELEAQIRAWAKGELCPDINTFPHELAFNVIPEVGGGSLGGETGEELKLREESRKILGLPRLPIVATCVRVPTLRSHAVALTVTCEEPVDIIKARAAFAQFSGLVLEDNLKEHVYPMPLLVSQKTTISIGRLRLDPDDPCRFSLFVAGDQLLKGAAYNALQISNMIIDNHLS